MDVRIHKILRGSRAHGPGIRNVVWFQGCSLGCSGCFNPLTHDPAGGNVIPVNSLAALLLAPSFPCDGITISGGEPFQQPEALLSLLQLLREKNSPPVLVFSGYPEAVLRGDELFSACLGHIDALICGPFRQDQPPAYDRFCSSRNQELVILSERYHPEDFRNLPLNEIIIDRQGNAEISGIYF